MIQVSKIPFLLQENISFKKEARHLSIKIKDVEIHNLYVPAGGDIPDPELNPKFADKLEFIDSVKKSKEPLSISYGLPNWGEYERFEALEITRNSKEIKFSRCMKPGEVFWYDKLNDIRIKIPSHCRSVAQNEAAKEAHDLSKFNNLINKYWVDTRNNFKKGKGFKKTSSKKTSSKKIKNS